MRRPRCSPKRRRAPRRTCRHCRRKWSSPRTDGARSRSTCSADAFKRCIIVNMRRVCEWLVWSMTVTKPSTVLRSCLLGSAGLQTLCIMKATGTSGVEANLPANESPCSVPVHLPLQAAGAAGRRVRRARAVFHGARARLGLAHQRAGMRFCCPAAHIRRDAHSMKVIMVCAQHQHECL